MLTIDIGNTRIKWAIWQDAQVLKSAECDHCSVFSQQLFEDCMPSLNVIDKIALINVAGDEAESVLKDWLGDKNNNELFVFKTEKECCGVINAYDDPSKHGVDRWAALIASKSLCETNICVIDIGTAVTVDVMSDIGQHEGGMIMPGLDMMRKSLFDNTSQLPYEHQKSIGHLGDFSSNTMDAVQNGTLNLLCAGLDDMCAKVNRRYENDVTIFLTGGLSEKILPMLSSLNLTHEPLLVLKGLRIAASN